MFLYGPTGGGMGTSISSSFFLTSRDCFLAYSSFKSELCLFSMFSNFKALSEVSSCCCPAVLRLRRASSNFRRCPSGSATFFTRNISVRSRSMSIFFQKTTICKFICLEHVFIFQKRRSELNKKFMNANVIHLHKI